MAGTRLSTHWWQELEAPHTKQVAGCFVLLKQVAGTRISSHWWQELEAPHTKQVAGWTARLVSCKRGSWCPTSSLLRLLLSRKRWQTQRPWPEFSVRSRWTSFFFATRRSWNHKLNPCFLASWFLLMSHQNSSTRPWSMLSSSAKTRGRGSESKQTCRKEHPERQSRLISTKCLCDESGWGI